jgi:hypothetical protein
MDKRLDYFKNILTIALGVYPIFVELYAAGLFWDIPNDILGGFSFGDFVFKSSVAYTSSVGFVIAYFLASSSLIALIDNTPQSGNSKPAPISLDLPWSEYSLHNKRRHILSSIGIVILFIIAFWIDTPTIGIDPSLFAGVLGAAFILAIIARPFILPAQWAAATILYFLSWAVVAPAYMGFNDAQPDKNSPSIKMRGGICSVILVGSGSVIARCGNGYALITKDKLPSSLYWTVSEDIK